MSYGRPTKNLSFPSKSRVKKTMVLFFFKKTLYYYFYKITQSTLSETTVSFHTQIFKTNLFYFMETLKLCRKLFQFFDNTPRLRAIEFWKKNQHVNFQKIKRFGYS